MNEHSANLVNIFPRYLRLRFERIDVNFGFLLEVDFEEVGGKLGVSEFVEVGSPVALWQCAKNVIDIFQ